MSIDELEALTVAWTPPPGAFEASPAGRMAARYGIHDPRALAERAAADPAWYWAAGMVDLGIPYHRASDVVGFSLNVALFIPGAAAAALLWRRVRWWQWVLVGFAVSAGIETMQGLFFASREAEVRDLTPLGSRHARPPKQHGPAAAHDRPIREPRIILDTLG